MLMNKPGSTPLISIITVVHNGGQTLEQTIKSVLDQTYTNIDFLIIDGASTDNTLDIIKKYDSRLKYWISEKDNGIFYAMNKGITAVIDKNSFLLFLNADDYLYDSKTIETVVSQISDEDFIYGKIQSVGDSICVCLGQELTFNELPVNMIQHQATFVKRKLFDEAGLFDTSYKIAADYEFGIRILKNHSKIKFIDVVVAVMRMGGAGSKNYMTTFREKCRVISNYYRGFIRLKALLFINLYEMPKHFLSNLLHKIGLLHIWRKWKTSNRITVL
jgi:glycosyltransferase involved in cell wall biosynthesis